MIAFLFMVNNVAACALFVQNFKAAMFLYTEFTLKATIAKTPVGVILPGCTAFDRIWNMFALF